MDIKFIKAVMYENPKIVNDFRLSGDPGDLKYLIDLIELHERAEAPNLTKDFYKDLTESEDKAFQFIREALNFQNGYISIVKLIQKTNISRPVYTSLLLKMEKFGIARVKNCGVKGTLIEWITTFTKD